MLMHITENYLGLVLMCLTKQSLTMLILAEIKFFLLIHVLYHLLLWKVEGRFQLLQSQNAKEHLLKLWHKTEVGTSFLKKIKTH